MNTDTGRHTCVLANSQTPRTCNHTQPHLSFGFFKALAHHHTQSHKHTNTRKHKHTNPGLNKQTKTHTTTHTNTQTHKHSNTQIITHADSSERRLHQSPRAQPDHTQTHKHKRIKTQHEQTNEHRYRQTHLCVSKFANTTHVKSHSASSKLRLHQSPRS